MSALLFGAGRKSFDIAEKYAFVKMPLDQAPNILRFQKVLEATYLPAEV